MLFLREEKALAKLFDKNRSKSKEIIKMIKGQENLLWIGRTKNSKHRIEDFLSSIKRKNSLQESIAQLKAGKDIVNDKNKYQNIRAQIAEWLEKNTVFYVRLCSSFKEPNPEIIKKDLIKKYNPPFNRKYNKSNFNKILFAG